MSQQLTRRLAMQSLTMGGLVAMAGSKGTEAAEAAESATPLKGNIKHSVCRWCYGRIPLDDLCKAAKAIGIESIDLQGPKEWPILQKYGLTCAMGNGAGMGITKGFNRVELHDRLVADYEKLFPQAAAADIPNGCSLCRALITRLLLCRCTCFLGKVVIWPDRHFSEMPSKLPPNSCSARLCEA